MGSMRSSNRAMAHVGDGNGLPITNKDGWIFARIKNTTKIISRKVKMLQSDSLEAIFFMWSALCEISKSSYLYAGGDK
ncbi:hypothetical protein Tco_0358681, partial [Tanacetum coccineum]